MVLTVGSALYLATGIAILALSGLLLAMQPRGRASRALALFLFLRGATLTIGESARVFEWALGARVFPYVYVALPVAVVWFLAIYPAPRWPFLARPWAAVPFAATGILLVGLYASNPNLYFGSEEGLAPLSVIGDLWPLAYATATWVLARDAVRANGERLRITLLLMALGFGVTSAFTSAHLLVTDVAFPGASVFHAWEVGGRIASLALFADAIRRVRAANLPGASGFVGGLAACAALGVLAAFAPGDLALVAVAAVRPIQPAILVYAIFRHRLFDVDVKARWTIRQSTIAAAFLGAFFVVSEAAATFLTESIGPYAGLLAAGALVFALAPLQRSAERVARAVVPEPATAATSADRYREAAIDAWSDGSLDRGERALLDHLQRALGIPAEEAMRIEQEAARATLQREA